MIPKCAWCGRKIWPWSRNVFKTMFGLMHAECHVERNQKVTTTVHLAEQLWETT